MQSYGFSKGQKSHLAKKCKSKVSDAFYDQNSVHIVSQIQKKYGITMLNELSCTIQQSEQNSGQKSS